MPVYSIIKKSELEGALRLDAEYYQPEYLAIISKLKSQNSKLVGELTSDIRYGLYIEPDYLDEGVNFIRAMNLLDFGMSGEILKIDESKVSKDYRLKIGDNLIVRSGANTGCVSLVYSRMEKSSFGSYIIRLRFDKINPFFASTFLNTKYGRLQTDRLQTGMAQPNLNIPNIKEIIVPIVSEEKQKEVEGICMEFEEINEQAGNLYFQVEQLLLKELGLENFKEQDDLFSIVKFLDIKKIKRMDAEYFQPKYEKIISRIKQTKHSLLGDLVSIKKGIEIGAEQYQENGKTFIRVSSLSKQGIIDKDQKYLSDELYQKLKADFEPKIGEVLLTKDATPGIAYVLKEQIDGIISSGVLRLKLKQKIEPEYLALFINSDLGKSQAERDAGGSIISHWKTEQVKNLVVPILSQEVQRKIAELVVKSYQARQKAKELLGQAKQKVEDLIEKI